MVELVETTCEDNRKMSLTSNVTEKANLLWNIAEKLTGSYKPHEYGLVILHLTVIRSFDYILELTHDKILAKAKEIEKMPRAIKSVQFQQITGHPYLQYFKLYSKRNCKKSESGEQEF